MRKQFTLVSKFLATASLVAHLSWSAEAAPIVLADSLVTPPLANTGGTVSPPIWEAIAFSTTATPLSLVSALIPLHFGNTANSTGPGLTVSLFSDASGAPGSSLVTLLHGLLPPSDGIDNSSVNFTPSTPFLLAANTTYWIVAASSGPDYVWQFASSPGTGPGFIPGRALSFNNGTDWNANANTLAVRVTADDVAAPELSGESLNLALGVTAAVFALALSRRGTNRTNRVTS